MLYRVDTPLLVALVAAVAGLLTSSVSLFAQRRTAERQGKTQLEVVRLGKELDRQREVETRERDTAEQLARFREPLLDASRDLLHRVRNVREMGFLGYLDAQAPRSRIAMLGTLFRFAKYWGTVERLYGTVSLLALESNSSTKHIANLLTTVGSRFADDSAQSGGQLLMIWREEQRAIAELMQRDAPADKPVIGFATFTERYEQDFARWFVDFEAALHSDGVARSPRLELLQEDLSRLVAELTAGRLPDGS
jgi:hypothetical protein